MVRPGTEGSAPRLIVVVNSDWFFVSHRLRLARAARAAGYRVEVVAGESEARRHIEAAGFPFHPLRIDRGGTHPGEDAATLGALVGLYRRLRPDLVHHVTVKPVVYGSLAARLTGVAAVVNAVSGLGYAFISQPGEPLRHRALRAGVQGLYRAALAGSNVRTVFQNATDRDAFVAAGLVAAQRTVLVPGSGVDLRRFAPAPLPPGDPVVVLPARLLRDKGVVEFVEAARALRGRHPRARFVLLGRLDPDNPAALSGEQVAGWVAEGVVEWPGAVEHDAMPGWLARAHLVVLPSYREGLPLVLAEAAAVGRAVVTTDVPGCRDAVLPGETGWLCPARSSGALAEAMDQALSDPEGLARRGTAGTALARARFAEEAIHARLLAVYAEVRGSRG